MFSLFGIGFTTPWILGILAALPILWIILRAIPPAPLRRLFPAVVLLLGLRDEDAQTDRTPLWLLLLRALAVAALIVAFAGPVLNPRERLPGSGPLLILVDGGWAGARSWEARIERIRAELQDAARDGRPVALVMATDLPPGSGELPLRSGGDLAGDLPGMEPRTWQPDGEALGGWIDGLEERFDTLWVSDGLGFAGYQDVLSDLRARGAVRVVATDQPIVGLSRAEFVDGTVVVPVLRSDGPAQTVQVAAVGPDPAGTERILARTTASFEAGQTRTEAVFAVQPELRNRFTRFEIDALSSAGAVSLTDDALKRREVALLTGQDDREGLRLLSPAHYLRQALEPTADLLDAPLADILQANPDVIILADVATLAPGEAEGIQSWVEKGGLLVRFAGPRLASAGAGTDEPDPLLPVRLRPGGRSIGGTMSWGEPRALRTFGPGSPFFGLAIPEDVEVSAQVLAQPDAELPDRTIATLEDGTPLVTRKGLGQGQVVLFHVTANADWSTLPLSGLFVQMLERLAVSIRPAQPSAADLSGTRWAADRLLDGFGVLAPAETPLVVAGEDIAGAQSTASTPAGLYAGEDRSLAVNVLGPEAVLEPASWPADIAVEGLETEISQPLKGHLLLLALVLLAADAVAAMWLSGRLTGARATPAALALAGLLALSLAADPVRAQASEDFALEATASVVLAHVLTGDPETDRVARAGLIGLSDTLFARTSVEPADPIGVDVEADELAFFPLLYWPVTPAQEPPGEEAYAKLNNYLRSGGMIVFDTGDADVAGFGGATARSRHLQRLALPLDIPPLEMVPSDHVLTRTFYLLQDFPGRFNSREVWVEAAPPGAERAEGMPFRNLNDNVTPVVIGGNDWAAAWAVDGSGNWMFPVGRGQAGERQREIALRFGVNLVMHVLTGNYKSDQVHVPALLDRLGQ